MASCGVPSDGSQGSPGTTSGLPVTGSGTTTDVEAEDLAYQLGGDDLRRAALGDDPARLHRDQVVGVAGRLVEVVQHGDHGAARARG